MSGARPKDRRRGQPLAMLGVVLAGWVALRVMLWEPGAGIEAELGFPPSSSASTRVMARAAQSTPNSAPQIKPTPLVLSLSNHCASLRAACPTDKTKSNPSTSSARADFGAGLGAAFQPPKPREPMIQPRVAAGHQLMMLAALGQLPLPPLLAAQANWPTALPAPRQIAPTASRWSGDGWVLLRRGSDGLAAAPSASPAFGRYGASQAGAVLRYSLVPASALRPQAHLRLTRALVGARGQGGESEAAAGLSARPLSSVPLRLYAEGRAQRTGGQTRLRPAASLVSELPPLRLPLGAQAELYAQGGYVGGRDATPFFDAQLTADRKLVASGPAELRLGAGAWAGGQEGATRLDLGPRASLRLQIGEAPSRLALDWRFRVAGKAAPASGPALTLSAGF